MQFGILPRACLRSFAFGALVEGARAAGTGLLPFLVYLAPEARNRPIAARRRKCGGRVFIPARSPPSTAFPDG